MKYENVDLRAAGIDLKPGEPWFLIRGQDVLAPAVIRYYASELSDYISPDKWDPSVAQVQEFAEQVRQWQAANPQHVKVPD